MIKSLTKLTFVYYFAFSQVPVSTEVMIEATGIYRGKGKKDKKKIKDVGANGVSGATLDAKKSAVYFVLYGGTDPLLSSAEEKLDFIAHEAFFFNKDNISHYISYEDINIMKKLKTDGGKGLKIVKRFKVNKELLTKDLEARNILEARSDLAETVGNPFIMVLPSV